MWLLMLFPGNYSFMEPLPPEVEFASSELANPEEPVQAEESPLTKEEIKEIIRQMIIDNNDVIRDIIREEIRALQEEAAEPKMEENSLPPVPVEETPIMESPKPVLYFYTLGVTCPPCTRMSEELSQNTDSMQCTLLTRPYPLPFQDGAKVLVYPSCEIIQNGKLVKRYEGYVPVSVLIQDLNSL